MHSPRRAPTSGVNFQWIPSRAFISCRCRLRNCPSFSFECFARGAIKAKVIETDDVVSAKENCRRWKIFLSSPPSPSFVRMEMSEIMRRNFMRTRFINHGTPSCLSSRARRLIESALEQRIPLGDLLRARRWVKRKNKRVALPSPISRGSAGIMRKIITMFFHSKRHKTFLLGLLALRSDKAKRAERWTRKINISAIAFRTEKQSSGLSSSSASYR